MLRWAWGSLLLGPCSWAASREESWAEGEQKVWRDRLGQLFKALFSCGHVPLCLFLSTRQSEFKASGPLDLLPTQPTSWRPSAQGYHIYGAFCALGVEGEKALTGIWCISLGCSAQRKGTPALWAWGHPPRGASVGCPPKSFLGTGVCSLWRCPLCSWEPLVFPCVVGELVLQNHLLPSLFLSKNSLNKQMLLLPWGWP